MVNDMRDTQYLFQPRRPGTAWLFRMKTPEALISKKNPRTGEPYKGEIREGLDKTRNLIEARKKREILLGQIIPRLQEAEVLATQSGSPDDVLEWANNIC